MAQSIYPQELRSRAITLLRSGTSNVAVADQLGVPYGTIGKWKFQDRHRHPDIYPPMRHVTCPICDAIGLNAGAYSYLLGLYLGDGHIIRRPKLNRFAIFCADAWPGLINAAESTMQTVLPGDKTFRVQRQGCTAVTSYSKHWMCLFPQHGPGRKHTRRIRLETWQEAILEQHPKDFVRGLIHSDGCRVINWTTKIVIGEKKRYEYPRYFFVNQSGDIRDLYTSTLDTLGIAWARTRDNCISVARRDSVAALDRFVGPKY
jgi:hypothetical protein